MGLCASVASPVHDADYDYGVDDIVVYENKNHSANEAFKAGSVYSHQGNKGLNQDAAILSQGYGMEDGALGGVFDGHGKNGHIVSIFVRNRLPLMLLNRRLALGKISSPLQASTSSPELSENLLGNQTEASKNRMKWKDAVTSAFMEMDKEIKLLEKFDCSCSGTAAVVAVKLDDDLLIANLGDSRAILGTRIDDGVVAVQLTTEQKPSVASEAERIRKSNGRVFALKEEQHIERVWLPNKDSPGLAMSRALGDFVLKTHGLIALPDVSYHHLSPDDQFVVLATDGVWDVMSNDEVASIVCSTNSEEEAAKAVVDASVAAWQQKFPNSKRDDSTVICLFLQKKQQINLPIST